VLLRVLLAAQRAGVKEVVIVGGDDPTGLLKRTRRLQLAWRWLPEVEDAAGSREVKALLRAAGEVDGEFVLLFADSILDPPALRWLREQSLDGCAVRAATSAAGAGSTVDASAYLCGPEFLRMAEGAAREGVESVNALFARLQEQGKADVVEVEGSVWPRTTDRGKLRAIQLELAHVSIKPSDGFYARFNKRVLSQPLITFFLNTPATPNFITGLGLTLALGAAGVMANGGYWWMLLGSVLWFLSSLMDHCDGMVARLKFMESDFGTWFEGTVDNTATLVVYIGMAIGLYRETGVAHHLVVGGLLVFGAVMSFVTTAHQRKRFSGDNPADYPNRMHRKLEENSGNLFLWFGRKAYFIARRAVLPYYMLLFCLLDFRVLFLGWSSLGANVYWIFTLYSNRLLRPAAVPKTAGAAEGD
jgi:phosphatidylglycerophosphate synthase